MPSASAVSPRQSSMSIRASCDGATTGFQRASTAVRSGPSSRSSARPGRSPPRPRPRAAGRQRLGQPQRPDPGLRRLGREEAEDRRRRHPRRHLPLAGPAQRRKPGQSGLRRRKSRNSSQFPAPSRSRVQVTRSCTTWLPVRSRAPSPPASRRRRRVQRLGQQMRLRRGLRDRRPLPPEQGGEQQRRQTRNGGRACSGLGQGSALCETLP